MGESNAVNVGQKRKKSGEGEGDGAERERLWQLQQVRGRILWQSLLGSGHIKDSTVAASLCCHFIHLRTTMATSLWHLSLPQLAPFMAIHGHSWPTVTAVLGHNLAAFVTW